MNCDANGCTENYKTENISLVTHSHYKKENLLSVLSLKYIHRFAPGDETDQKCDNSKAVFAFPSELTLVILVHVK